MGGRSAMQGVRYWILGMTAVFLFCKKPEASEEAASGNFRKGAKLYSQTLLKLRDKPSATVSKVLTMIPLGGEIQTTGDQPEGQEITVDGYKGRWLLVSYGNQTGYVFEGYVSRHKAITDPSFERLSGGYFVPGMKDYVGDCRSLNPCSRVEYTERFSGGAYLKFMEMIGAGNDLQLFVPAANMQEFYLVFHRLCNMPTGSAFPESSREFNLAPDKNLRVEVRKTGTEITEIRWVSSNPPISETHCTLKKQSPGLYSVSRAFMM